MDKPLIFVACLAAYNNGRLHGDWIDATQGETGVIDAIQAILDSSPESGSEEFIILDDDGFGHLVIGEYESIATVVKYAAIIEEYGELGSALLCDYEVAEISHVMDLDYQGCYDSEVDFAYDLFNEIYANILPDNLICYIDFEFFARDVFIGDYYSIRIDGQTHVFLHS